MVATKSEEALGLRGLHLYHAGQSNCAARVRLQMEEKGLSWTSHHIDLLKKENIDPAYFAINPKGLVPAFVHDGRVVIESGDIMLYLEEQFPEPSFAPDDTDDRARMEDWVRRSGSQHIPAIKTYAYIKVNARLAAKTPDEVKRYFELQKDPELIRFHSKHDLPGASFSEEDEREAVALIESILAEMRATIEADGWLAGPDYSLADMAWATSYRTLQLARYPLDESDPVAEWYARVTERPAWGRMMHLWLNPPLEPRVQEFGPSKAA
jgi:glutathione S-transferase